MKRAIRIVVLACALTVGTGAGTAAHTLYVDNGVVQPIGTGTPRIFDDEYNVIAHPNDPENPNNRSTASHGTNVACEAVGTDGPVAIYGGPSCKKPSN